MGATGIQAGAPRALAVAAIALLAILGLVAEAAAQPTKVHDGDEPAVRPASLSGWHVADSTGRVHEALVTGLEGRPSGDRLGIRWKSWRKKKAVGQGRAWSLTCPSGCDGAYPWDGYRVRVTAYRPRKGAFTRLKVFHWTEWGSPNVNDENYNLTLKYVGDREGADSWKVAKLRDGLAMPAEKSKRGRRG